MPKHRFRTRIKSIVGSLIDPDNDEDLKDTNLETEDNYKKILELLNDNNQDDKIKLTGLIEDFHKHYQSIYQRYDNITGKLKEKVRSKKENFSSSSSSSSDSDSSSKKKESKNGMVETSQISQITDALKVELETANTEIEELNRKLKVETEEKEALILQYQAALNKVEETEEMLNDSKLQTLRFNEECSRLMAEKETAMAVIEDERKKYEELRAITDSFESELEDIKKTSEEEKSNLIQKLETSEAENKSLSEEKEFHVSKIKELENGIQSKERVVDELEETIEDLKTDLEIKGDEVNTLTETVRNLEVKIRLSNQKLRITEQLLNETEHDHATKEEKLHERNEILADKIATLYEALTFVKREVQEKVNEAVKGFDLLTVKFEEDYGHVMTRVCEIRNEVRAVEIQARVNRSTNEFLKKKVEEEVKKLNDVKDIILKKDEKIKELEGVICGKDEEILCVCEDKIDAIRQLCLWSDYQRDRYDCLREALTVAR